MKRHRHPAVRHPRGRQPEPADPEAFVRRAASFRALAVDASSLIVLADIGLLDAAGKTWRLHTLPAVAAEAGAAARDVALLPAVGTPAADTPTNNDQALLAAALRAGLPLLTEDRRLLIAAEEADLDCFDVLVALELLLATGTLDPERHQAARAGLLRRNEYRPYRLVWAEAVGIAAAKFIR